MAESSPNRPFTVQLGSPTRILASDLEGKEFEIAVKVAVLAVRPTGKKDGVTGNSEFEIDFQVMLNTKAKDSQ